MNISPQNAELSQVLGTSKGKLYMFEYYSLFEPVKFKFYQCCGDPSLFAKLSASINLCFFFLMLLLSDWQYSKLMKNSEFL